MLVEIAICLLIVYRMATFWQTKMQDRYYLNLTQYYIGRVCFTSNDKGKLYMTNLTQFAIYNIA